MKKFLLLVVLSTLLCNASAVEPQKVKPVKNIILLISDGTSFGAVSAARWLQFYRDPSRPKLNLDPWLCGTVRTNNSDAPIGDSAPTTSCYVTGHSSRAGYVATFPPDRGKDNIEPVDSLRAYAPMASVLEAGRILHNKALGMVFTCHFCHATPADCSAHYYSRNAYGQMSEQIVHNSIDVVIGGGNDYLSKDAEAYLKKKGYQVYRNDIAAMRSDKSSRMWSLFDAADMDYDMDRDSLVQPSLAEMTSIAINKLSKKKEGFFLMVEGSKVDWAAHDNDPAALLNEFLAFDKACGVALDFAKRDGNTVVIITADHGNSGISIGRANMGDYSHASKDKLFKPLSAYKRSADGMEKLINSHPFDSLRSLFKKYEDIDLSNEEVQLLINCKGYKQSPIPQDLRQPDKASALYSSYLSGVISKILSSRTPFGWTTGGHTGEEVFLACYNPRGQRPMGMKTNVELAHYIQALFGVYGKMDDFTDQIFAPHKSVFRDYACSIVHPTEKNQWPVLEVKNTVNGRQIRVKANSNIVESYSNANAQPQTIELKSIVTYVDRNDMFYLPSDLYKLLK